MKTDAGNADNSTVFAWAHDALVRIYNDAGNVIETHEHKGDLRSGDTFFLKLAICVTLVAAAAAADLFPSRRVLLRTQLCPGTRDSKKLRGPDRAPTYRSEPKSAASAAQTRT
jgi:hypothetical protein